MKYLLVTLLFAVITACSPSLMNLTEAKNNVISYYENGSYDTELNKIVVYAEEKLSEITTDENSAIIFDVDETVLSNYNYIKELNFGYRHDIWVDWLKESRATAIVPVKGLYKWAIARGIKVIFLTGRSDEVYHQTYRNLLLEGFTEIEQLVCRSDDELKLSAADFKTAKRKSLTESGFNIIATVGDLNSDLKGSYTGLKIKLPNYLYDID